MEDRRRWGVGVEEVSKALRTQTLERFVGHCLIQAACATSGSRSIQTKLIPIEKYRVIVFTQLDRPQSCVINMCNMSAFGLL